MNFYENTYLRAAKWNFDRMKKYPRNKESHEHAMYWALFLAAEAGEI